MGVLQSDVLRMKRRDWLCNGSPICHFLYPRPIHCHRKDSQEPVYEKNEEDWRWQLRRFDARPLWLDGFLGTDKRFMERMNSRNGVGFFEHLFYSQR